MFIIQDTHSSHWAGWYFDDQGFLRDPAGNGYAPNDLRSAHWGRQLYREQVGSPFQVRTLKQHLEERLDQIGRVYVEVRRESSKGTEILQTIALTGT